MNSESYYLLNEIWCTFQPGVKLELKTLKEDQVSLLAKNGSFLTGLIVVGSTSEVRVYDPETLSPPGISIFSVLQFSVSKACESMIHVPTATHTQAGFDMDVVFQLQRKRKWPIYVCAIYCSISLTFLFYF